MYIRLEDQKPREGLSLLGGYVTQVPLLFLVVHMKDGDD